MSDDPDLPLPTGPVDLANFQVDAVRWCLNTIDRYGGCYIGDVVGLGKTYIGAELLRQLKQSYLRDGNPPDHLSGWTYPHVAAGLTNNTT